jgi:uncharacterized protein (DUF924 family)
MSPQPSAQDVLFFWFGPRPYTAARIQQHARLWFGEPDAPEITPQTDDLIRERYANLTLAAERGELSAWESSPRRRLALILLLDQFPRNAHRGTAQAFAFDHVALPLALMGLQFGADAALHPVERVFFYAPLMHAESAEVQEESVAAYRRLRGEAPTELAEILERSLEFALLHQDIVHRFGRFPHRNQALGRASSEQETAWLALEGERFGQ